MDPSGQFSPGFWVGIFAGGYTGFLSGFQKGDFLSAALSGVDGAAVGGLVGIVAPHLSPHVAAALGGAIGGATANVLYVYDTKPCPSPWDYLKAVFKGGLIGGATGYLYGKVIGLAGTVGATGVAAHVSAAMITAPINWGLELIDF